MPRNFGPITNMQPTHTRNTMKEGNNLKEYLK